MKPHRRRQIINQWILFFWQQSERGKCGTESGLIVMSHDECGEPKESSSRENLELLNCGNWKTIDSLKTQLSALYGSWKAVQFICELTMSDHHIREAHETVWRWFELVWNNRRFIKTVRYSTDELILWWFVHARAKLSILNWHASFRLWFHAVN